jgi:hypothetical protein
LSKQALLRIFLAHLSGGGARTALSRSRQARGALITGHWSMFFKVFLKKMASFKSNNFFSLIFNFISTQTDEENDALFYS